MDSQQQFVAVHIVTGGNQTLGQHTDILVVERETAIAATVVVREDTVGLAVQFERHHGLLHFDIIGRTLTKIIDHTHLEALRPEDATVVGIGLLDNELTALITGMDIRHTLLLDPYIAELADVEIWCLFCQHGDEVVPRGIAELVFREVLVQGALQHVRPHHILQHTHHDSRLIEDDVVVEQTGVVGIGHLHRNGMGTFGTVGG